MSFVANAITGILTLDESPAMKAMERVAKGAHTMASGFGSALSGIGSSLAAVATEGMSSLVEGIGMGMGEKLEELPAMLAEKIHGAMESMEATSQAANALGVATEKYTELTYAANQAHLGSDGLAMALKMMSNNLGEAAMGGGEAADSLKLMGLSARDLAAASPDEALRKIADGINKMGVGSERTRLSMSIFGREAGPGLSALLDKGSAGIDEMAKRAHALGVTFNDVDAAKVMQANEAMKDVGAVITGVLQTAAIAVAPYIQGIAEEFTKAAAAGGGFGQYAVDAVEAVAKGVAYAADAVSLFEAGWYALKATVIAAMGGALKAIGMVGTGIVDMINLIPGYGAVDNPFAEFNDMADDMAVQAVEAFDKASDAMDDFTSGKHSQQVQAFFDGVKKSAQSSAEASAQRMEDMRKGSGAGAGPSDGFKVLGDLQKQVDQSGMNEFQKMWDDIKRDHLFPPEDLDKAKDFIDKLDAADFRKSIETPLDKFNKAKENADALLKAGDISTLEYSRGIAAASKDAFGQQKLPSLFRAGSAEAQAARFDGARQANDLPSLVKQQNAIALKNNDLMKTLVSIWKGIRGAEPTGM